MAILDEIRSNSITTLHLSTDPDDIYGSTKEFVDALEKNESIEEVVFDKDFIACIYGNERGDILEAVALLPNLHSVKLADACLMVSFMSQMTKLAKGLRSFTLDKIVLQGVQSDFDAFEAALMQHGNLKEFHMNDCITANDGLDMEKIVKAGKNITKTSLGEPSKQISKSAIAA